MAESVPDELWLTMLRDDLDRDLITARRAALLSLLWLESYQTRESLMTRTQLRLGQECFNRQAVLTFRRDMQAVKAILAVQGYELKYSRRPERPGYFIPGRPAFAPERLKAIRGAVQEVDPYQIEIFNRMTPQERLERAGQLSADVLDLAIQSLMVERPGLSRSEAQREVLHRYYQFGS